MWMSDEVEEGESVGNVHFGDDLLSVALRHPFKVEFLARKYLRSRGG